MRLVMRAEQRAPPVWYHSGSNEVGDIAGMDASGHAICAAAKELWRPRVEALKKVSVPVLIDSGAFSEVDRKDPTKVVAPMDDNAWRRVLSLYHELADALGSKLTVAAPDRVASQSVTLERMRTYATDVQELLDKGAHVLVPLQRGERSPLAFERAAMDALDLSPHQQRRIVPAFPMMKAATDPATVVDYVRQRKPRRVHLLGLGPRSQKVDVKGLLQKLHEASPATEVTLDSGWKTASVGRAGKGRRLTRAKDLVDTLAGGDAGPFARLRHGIPIAKMDERIDELKAQAEGQTGVQLESTQEAIAELQRLKLVLQARAALATLPEMEAPKLQASIDPGCPHCGEPIETDMLLDPDGTDLLDWQPCCQSALDHVTEYGWDDFAGETMAATVGRSTGLEPSRIAEGVGDDYLVWPLEGHKPGPGVKGWQGHVFGLIDKHHRHHNAPQGWKAGVAVTNGRRTVGVGVLGRPVSWVLEKRWPDTLEVTRVATWGRDEQRRNAATKTYALCAQEAKRMGYNKLITYTLADEESGHSLRAAGFTPTHRGKGGSWSRKDRPREDNAPTGAKIRWERALNSRVAPPDPNDPPGTKPKTHRQDIAARAIEP